MDTMWLKRMVDRGNGDARVGRSSPDVANAGTGVYRPTSTSIEHDVEFFEKPTKKPPANLKQNQACGNDHCNNAGDYQTQCCRCHDVPESGRSCIC